MFTEELLKKFKLRISGDEGDPVDPDPADPNNNNDPDPADPDPDDQNDDDKLDLSKLDPKAQKLIKDLRAENAKRRTDHNNLSSQMEKIQKGLKTMFGEEDDTDPEVQLETVQSQLESTVTRNAILELALENGISGSENVEYFEFQMNKALNSLEEGEEMSEEQLEEVLAKCSGVNGKANTSTKENNGDKGPDKNDGETSQAEFDKMTIMQKSKLYQQKPELYNQLMKGTVL